MKTKLLCLAALFAASSSAFAASGSVQFGFIADTALDFESTSQDADGDGLSINLSLKPTDGPILIYATHLSREYENVLELDQTRIGVGASGSNNKLGYWLGLNYEILEVGSADGDGLGVRGGLSFAFNDKFSLYGEVGSVFVSDEYTEVSGGEFSVGLAFGVTPQVSLFTDIRSQVLDVEDTFAGGSEEITLTDFRLGVGVFF